MDGKVLGNTLFVRTSNVAATHLRDATTWVFQFAATCETLDSWQIHRNGTGRFTGKPGEGFRWDTADGAQRREQIRRQRKRYSSAWSEAKLEAEEWQRRPLRVKVSAMLIECLLWPLKMIGRFRG